MIYSKVCYFFILYGLIQSGYCHESNEEWEEHDPKSDAEEIHLPEPKLPNGGSGSNNMIEDVESAILAFSPVRSIECAFNKLFHPGNNIISEILMLKVPQL